MSRCGVWKVVLLTWGTLALPLSVYGEDRPIEKRYLDIPYARHEGTRPRLTSLDLYAPAGAKRLPIVVFIHGGGWRQGDKGNVQGKPALFCGRGYLFASINYRLSPAVKHPAHIEDVAAALAWLTKHAEEYGGDGGRMAVIGHSAGAHLAGLIATDHRRWEAAAADPAALRGAVLLDGALYHAPKRAAAVARERDFFLRTFGPSEEQLLDASPVHHARPGRSYPRVLIVHAGERELSRVQGELLAAALREAGGYAELLHAPEKDHGGVNRDIGRPRDAMTARILAFLEECFAAAEGEK